MVSQQRKRERVADLHCGNIAPKNKCDLAAAKGMAENLEVVQPTKRRL